LWTPCVGPILASVISLAISGTVTLDAFIITFAYSLGTAIPMFLIMIGGQTMLRKIPWLLANTVRIQRGFGILMIVTAIGIFYNADRALQTYILTSFPQYGVGLTKFEDNKSVLLELKKVTQSNDMDKSNLGKPLQQKGPLAPEIIPGGEWFNTKPLTLAELKGKVVIIDFWTYTCINCQRTLPFVKEWWRKYQDKGLVIIGVHSPEFEFEKDKNNLAKAITDFNLTHPIVQDNDFSTWRAYENHYWPAKYIIDKDGYIRYTHFGEGEYDKTEEVIQELLKETGVVTLSPPNNSTSKTYGRTPETYLGYGRLDHFSSPEQIRQNMSPSYTSPTSLPENTFSLNGKWSIREEYAIPEKGSELTFNFDAKEVYLVMKIAGKPAQISVYIDDKIQNFGEDNINGMVTVNSDKLYKLISLPTPGKHILRLEFKDANAQLFAFTFG